MQRHLKLITTAFVLLLTSFSFAQITPEAARKLYDKVTPSMVAVQYTWVMELGQRQEVIGSGVVISEDGLVMTSLALFSYQGQLIPDNQMAEFKIIVPKSNGEPDEIDATFVGRDERTNLAFFKSKEPQKWAAVKFEDVPVNVGDGVLSVGLLPKNAGYRTYLAQAIIGAALKGPVPQLLVSSGGLCSVGSPVFNANGQAVGYVNFTGEQAPYLNPTRNALAAISVPPRLFVPTRDFLISFSDPPVADKPFKLPWVGIGGMTGLKKDLAEMYKFQDQTAVEITDVIPGEAADKAGLKAGDIILMVNGKPIERGDQADELPQILQRQLIRMHVGDKVTFSVSERGKPARDVELTLSEQPKRPNVVDRYYTDDLGFGARELTFYDTYVRKLPNDFKGVLVHVIKPQGAAENAKLQGNDLITEMNDNAITSLEQFKKAYEDFRKSNPNDAMKLAVLREGKNEVIRIEPPQ